MDFRDLLPAGTWTFGWSGVGIGVGLLVFQLVLVARVRGRWWELLGPLLVWLACEQLWWVFLNSFSCANFFTNRPACLNGPEPSWASLVWFVLLVITELITLGVGARRLARRKRQRIASRD